MDIRDIDGLWCDDITFCQETCERMDCPRNKHHIRDRSIPHSFSVEIPQDCPKRRICGEVAMRLIDADALADALFEKRKNYPQWVADTIGKMPDAVVRCMDCKYRRGITVMGNIVCVDNSLHSPEWYCADGERK